MNVAAEVIILAYLLLRLSYLLAIVISSTLHLSLTGRYWHVTWIVVLLMRLRLQPMPRNAFPYFCFHNSTSWCYLMTSICLLHLSEFVGLKCTFICLWRGPIRPGILCLLGCPAPLASDARPKVCPAKCVPGMRCKVNSWWHSISCSCGEDCVLPVRDGGYNNVRCLGS